MACAGNRIEPLCNNNDRCFICMEYITNNDKTNVTSTGINTFKIISKELKDGLWARIKRKPLPIPAHMTCRRTYGNRVKMTREAQRRLENKTAVSVFETIQRVQRSDTTVFNPVTDCFYCGQTIPFYRKCTLANLTDYDYKINKERRRCRTVMTDLIKPIKDKVIAFDSYSILNLLKIKVHSYLKQKSFHKHLLEVTSGGMKWPIGSIIMQRTPTWLQLERVIILILILSSMAIDHKRQHHRWAGQVARLKRLRKIHFFYLMNYE